MKHRTVNLFSLSFIDCICCGLGAVILLFVIINAKSAARRDEVVTDLRSETDRLEQAVIDTRERLALARNTLEKTIQELAETEGRSREVIRVLEEKKLELADSDKDTLASEAHINRLKADLRSLEEERRRLEAGSKSRDDLGARLRPFPGQGDRQYLTDLKMGGERIFILVDASASMLDDTIVGIVRRQWLPEERKRQSTKWRQAVSTIDWLTTQLPMTSRFQVYTYNETAQPVIAGTENRWLDAGDVEILNKTVDRMQKVVPQKGTSLFNAVSALKTMSPAPDNIFLLTDSLPTMGKNRPWTQWVSPKKRRTLFDEAVRMLPARVPVNVILYPMEGDPMAASLFWRLAVRTRGSFFCPSGDWP